MADIDAKLKQIVSSIESLEDNYAEIKEHIAAVYKDAAAQGFDVKIIRKIIALRKKDLNKVKEEEDLLEMYKRALGMI
jgi:uncharacterized protein (UPF0335 family)